jgi:hypothetical protein
MRRVFLFQYKIDTATNWIMIPVSTNSIALGDLQPGTVYQWQLLTICDLFPDSSDYSSIHEFNTIGTFSEGFDDVLFSMSLYPNPAREQVTISFTARQEEDLIITIKNVLGEAFEQSTLHANPGTAKELLDISDLPKGMYFLELRSEHSSLRKSFMVQ